MSLVIYYECRTTGKRDHLDVQVIQEVDGSFITSVVTMVYEEETQGIWWRKVGDYGPRSRGRESGEGITEYINPMKCRCRVRPMVKTY